MDAQNAAAADKTKRPASPIRPTARPADADDDYQKSDKPALDDQPSNDSQTDPARPPRSPVDQVKPDSNPNPTRADGDDAAGDRDSDAETIVLPGKDGHSPSKARKVKHEDSSDVDLDKPRQRRDASSARDQDNDKQRNLSANDGNEKKRARSEKPSRPREASSGLESTPKSPSMKRRRPAAPHDSESDPERKRSPKLTKGRAESTGGLVSHKRKMSRAGSEDDHEDRKAARRRRLEDHPDWLASKDARSASRNGKEVKVHRSKQQQDDARSASPPARTHRRSLSTQLSSSSNPANGLGRKKKHLPAPLRSTDYHSDDSSASGSSRPHSSKPRQTSGAGSNLSPAKAQTKRHVDAHGQTLLARACNKGEYELAKQRLMERPEDRDWPDNAQNTPLQTAALKGYDDVVKLLIDAGCNVDCVNSVKDTPLLDAVDNGHLDVIKLLLTAGANPRKANLRGQEPLDRVSEDLENADAIRSALVEAKQRHVELRRSSEDIQHTDHDARSSHGPESPRRSPPLMPDRKRRVGAGRSQRTGNHHLYVTLDDNTLRKAATEGDTELVQRVLQTKDRCDDPVSMVNASRGGHVLTMELLLALGGANPDPDPVEGEPREFSTPMLAAIGGENIQVIHLLLKQQNFDPTRRPLNATYFQLAQQRKGPNWKEEEQILKDAYNAAKKVNRDITKTKSPAKRDRIKAQQDRDAATQDGRSSGKEEGRSNRRNDGHSSREGEARGKSAARPDTSTKEKRRSGSNSHQVHVDDQNPPKEAASRPIKGERPTQGHAISDRETSPSQQSAPPKVKRHDSDMAAMSSEGETPKPRRKLVSKGELRGEKQRRASMASNASSLKDPSSPHNPKHDENATDNSKEPVSEKYHDRTKALRRDESKDRHSGSGDIPSKRHRASVTPPHSSSGDKNSVEALAKRRRLDSEGKEGKERRPKTIDSHDEQPKAAREGAPKMKPPHKGIDDEKHRSSKLTDTEPKSQDATKSTSKEESIHVKSEDVDEPMLDAPSSSQPGAAEKRAQKQQDKDEQNRDETEDITRKREKEERQRKREAEAARITEEEKRHAEEEAQRQADAERKRREEEEIRQREEEQKRKAAEEKKRREAEEEERKRKAAEEKKREEERQRQEEEDRKRKEEEERRRKEEEERMRKEEEERKRKEEELRKQREEEERIRKEELERQAAEEARLQKQEEERKEREHRERLKREEAERKRAEAHQAREEERLAKLPGLLRWLVTCPNPQQTELASRFRRMQGFRYDTIRPEAFGTPAGREQWVPNINVALLLGVKDLDLARYTGWERIPVPDRAKQIMYGRENSQYALTSPELRNLGAQLPGYYGEDDPHRISGATMARVVNECRDKFMKLDMFFVKLSELMYIVPTIPHLRNLKLGVQFCEVPLPSPHGTPPRFPANWKTDPDAEKHMGWTPRFRYYVNGSFVSEDLPSMTQVSKTPFPDHPGPRRGLQRVFPEDPDYEQICKQQGLEHLLPGSVRGQSSASLSKGVHPSPPASQDNDEITRSNAGNMADDTQPTTATASASANTGKEDPSLAAAHGVNGDNNSGNI